ncbi:MAG: polysaccharide biosynthesis/export family protein [Holophagales bacterium]|nr:MAG: polysaccharide biosynthesis/export family protein [Holophagales bacterium]
MSRFSFTALAVSALLSLAGPAASQTPLTSTASYRIGPKDLLDIKVFEVAELNVERRVAEDGSVNLPLIGDVPAQGLTDSEFARRLKDLLEAKYVQRASVAVQVREFRSRPIVVLGAVKSPGNLAFSGRWTLLEALSAAGGLSGEHGDLIYILRRADNGLTDQVAVRVSDLLVKADPKANLPIFANDLINVPGVTTVTVFFLGEVTTRGAIAFRSDERITLLAGVARAGGLSDRASSDIAIKRKGSEGGQIEIKANFKRILAGKETDPELLEGDVVVVKESFF